jgi:hypothetical protein
LNRDRRGTAVPRSMTNPTKAAKVQLFKIKARISNVIINV